MSEDRWNESVVVCNKCEDELEYEIDFEGSLVITPCAKCIEEASEVAAHGAVEVMKANITIGRPV